MDKYKKKSFMFANSSLSRNKRSTEIKNQRENTRHQRLSLLRNIDVNCETFENEKPITPKCEEKNQPVAGKLRPLSRLEMLEKWKEEKLMKKQLEAKTKKPVFKVEHIAYKPPPVLIDAKFIRSITDFKSSRKVSHISSSTVNNVSKVLKSKATPSIKIFQPSNRNNIAKVAQMKALPNINMSVTQRTARNNAKVVERKVTFLCYAGIVQVPSGIKVSHISQSALRNNSNVGKSKVYVDTHCNKNFTLTRNTNNKALPMQIPVSNKFPIKISSNKPNLPKTPGSNKITSTARNKLKKEDKGSISGKDLKKEPENLTQEDDVASSMYDETLKFDTYFKKPEERKSFAPKNFTFHPPMGMFNFDAFEDDPFAVYEKVKAEYRSLRVSTPRLVNSNPKKNTAEDHRNISEDKKTKNMIAKFNSNSFLEEMSHAEDEMEPKPSKFGSDDNLLGNDLKKEPENLTQQDDVAPSVYDETLKFDTYFKKPEERKSFAPKNFTFHPPMDMFNIDAFEDDPFAVYEKVKAEYRSLRVSTPRMVNSNPKFNDAIDLRNNSEDKKPKTPLLEGKSCSKNLIAKFNSNSFLEEMSHIEDELEPKPSQFHSDDNLLGNSSGKLSVSQDLDKQTLNTINESIESNFTLAADSETWRRKNSLLSESFTPRRSSRLARRSQKNSDLDEIFSNTKEGLSSSPTCHATNITYEFGQLCLEEKENENLNISPSKKTQQPIVKCNGDLKLQKDQLPAHSKQRKISLLYTPESKVRKSLRQSIRGDLMSFLPNT